MILCWINVEIVKNRKNRKIDFKSIFFSSKIAALAGKLMSDVTVFDIFLDKCAFLNDLNWPWQRGRIIFKFDCTVFNKFQDIQDRKESPWSLEIVYLTFLWFLRLLIIYRMLFESTLMHSHGPVYKDYFTFRLSMIRDKMYPKIISWCLETKLLLCYRSKNAAEITAQWAIICEAFHCNFDWDWKWSRFAARWHRYRQTKQQRSACLCLREAWILVI